MSSLTGKAEEAFEELKAIKQRMDSHYDTIDRMDGVDDEFLARERSEWNEAVAEVRATYGDEAADAALPLVDEWNHRPPFSLIDEDY